MCLLRRVLGLLEFGIGVGRVSVVVVVVGVGCGGWVCLLRGRRVGLTLGILVGRLCGSSVVVIVSWVWIEGGGGEK